MVKSHSDHLSIDNDSASAWAKSLITIHDEVKVAGIKSTSFPIRYDSLESEISFLALYHLLSFGSGWDAELKATRQGKESKELAQYGCIGMAISGQKIDKHFMTSFSPLHVHNFYGIESHVESPLPDLPGVMISKPGPLHSLVLAIQKAMNECGQALEAEGAKSIGEWIICNLKPEENKASDLVDLLSQTFPPFQDEALYDGRKIQFARKAQALVGSLYERFGERDARFAFVDMAMLTSDTSPASLAVLRSKGIISLSEELAGLIDAQEDLPSGPHERALRAAMIVVGDLIVEGSGGTFRAFQLGAFLQHQDGKPVKCHRTKCSSY